MNILAQLLHPQQAADERRSEIYRSLMHWTGQVGGKLFGEVPKGVRREFFCLDKQTWVWHEEWQDSDGHHALTTRYDIRPYGVLKSQGTSEYQTVTRQEAQNLYNAVTLYYNQVMPELRRMQQMQK